MSSSNASAVVSARLREAHAQEFYPVAERFSSVALQRDDSLFTPGRSIWTSAHLNELYQRLMLEPDTSQASFMTKFERQLADASADVYQLAAELIYVHVLFASKGSISAARKRALVNTVLGWSPAPVGMPEDLDQALSDGLARMGVAFGTYRPFQLGFLLDFVRSWKELSSEERTHLLADPWAFKQMLFSLPIRAAYAQREALLHMIHPDTFEPIVSRDHKQRLARAFAQYVTVPTDDLDRQLQQIRQQFTPEYGNGFSFYEPGLRDIWLGQYEPTPEPEPGAEVEAPPVVTRGTAGHVFICYAREDEEFALALAAQLKQRGIDIWIDQFNIEYGVDWDRAIDNALYDCGILLIILSPASVDSDEVRSELRVALNERRQIVPVLYQPCRIPRQLLHRQRADFTAHGPDDAQALQRLVRGLRG